MKENDNKSSIERPPIVAVLGHVDHGKTSLLDYIRKTNVAQKEAGGITQSIGAYEIIHNNKKITFVDTPGHEAFMQMRSRGAQIADLAILVVAADDGVMLQTKESIKILKETNTPFVVAITKIDKSNANIEKTKNDLMANEVFLEGYGGQISWQAVSSKTGEGINELLDLIILAAELEDLKYDPNNIGEGVVLEAHHDSKRGIAVTVIIKNGKVKRGDIISTKTAFGKIKILEDFIGRPVNELLPSAPARIIGFEKIPKVGEKFICNKDLYIEENNKDFKNNFKNEKDEDKNTLNLILKAKDYGSLEALSAVLENLPLPDDFQIKIISSSVGDVFDNDAKLAISSNAIVVVFSSDISKSAETLIKTNNIQVISSKIIYELIKILEEKIKEITNPKIKGALEILAVFNQKNLQKQIIGGRVVCGVFKNRAKFKIERNSEVIGDGIVLSLQSNKKDTNEVLEGNEAGLMVNSNIAIQSGDKLIIE